MVIETRDRHEDRKVATHDQKARAWGLVSYWPEAKKGCEQHGKAVSDCDFHSAEKGQRQECAAVGGSGMQDLAEREAEQEKWWRAVNSGSSSTIACKPACRFRPDCDWDQGC